MYCRRCGTNNADHMLRCSQCGAPLDPSDAQSVEPQCVPNYLIPSILITIFCCWPLGIPAIIYAAKVNGLAGAGDIAGAVEASRKAKMWMFISLGSGLAIILIYVALMVIGVMAGNM